MVAGPIQGPNGLTVVKRGCVYWGCELGSPKNTISQNRVRSSFCSCSCKPNRCCKCETYMTNERIHRLVRTPSPLTQFRNRRSTPAPQEINQILTETHTLTSYAKESHHRHRKKLPRWSTLHEGWGVKWIEWLFGVVQKFSSQELGFSQIFTAVSSYQTRRTQPHNQKSTEFNYSPQFNWASSMHKYREGFNNSLSQFNQRIRNKWMTRHQIAIITEIKFVTLVLAYGRKELKGRGDLPDCSCVWLM